MRALVTGHRGFVGRWLQELLQAEGIAVSGFDHAGVADIRDYESVRRAVELAQPDYVFHLAALAYVPEAIAHPHRAFDINCVGTVNLLEAVRLVAPPGCRVLVAGTSEEYGYASEVIDEDTPLAPTTVYGASKAAGSLAAIGYANQYRMPVVVTRAFNHTGPGQSPAYAVSSFARRIALIECGKLDRLEHGPLDGYRDLSDVRDVVCAYRLAIDAEPGVYNIASGQSRTVGAALADLIHLAEPGVSILLKARADDRPRIPPVEFRAEVGKIRATGWRMKVPWLQTLRDLLNYWRGIERQ